jgi:hypothetical protein
LLTKGLLTKADDVVKRADYSGGATPVNPHNQVSAKAKHPGVIVLHLDSVIRPG